VVQLKIITINLPIQYLSAIQTLIDLDIYPNRSEVIRLALEDFLESELQFDTILNPEKFKKQIEVITS